MPLNIIRNDITKMKVDAIVNAANNDLRQGGGVCGAIFRAAGAQKLKAACDKLAPIRTGEAVITKGYGLSAKYIIHTAGPVYSEHNIDENKSLLRAAYINSLTLAVENGCESIAFPLISSGYFGFPKEGALRIATEAIKAFLQENETQVFLVIFDRVAFSIGKQLLGKIESFINQTYVDELTSLPSARLLRENEIKFPFWGKPFKKSRTASKSEPAVMRSMTAFEEADLSKMIKHLDESFSETLLKLIDAKGKTDVEVYKRANIDRKLFSKIRASKGYTPSKRTALALAIALELSLDETESLLKRAGYALSQSSKFDVIITYFILNGQCDIFEINNVLFEYDQPILGS